MKLVRIAAFSAATLLAVTSTGIAAVMNVPRSDLIAPQQLEVELVHSSRTPHHHHRTHTHRHHHLHHHHRHWHRHRHHGGHHAWAPDALVTGTGMGVAGSSFEV